MIVEAKTLELIILTLLYNYQKEISPHFVKVRVIHNRKRLNKITIGSLILLDRYFWIFEMNPLGLVSVSFQRLVFAFAVPKKFTVFPTNQTTGRPWSTGIRSNAFPKSLTNSFSYLFRKLIIVLPYSAASIVIF